jgi:hypothetical protein
LSRASVVLAASLAATVIGACAPDRTTPVADPPAQRVGPTSATTRVVFDPPPVGLAVTRPTTTTAPTTATAPSDHHAAPPRRTGP